ncbi:5-(carboxyamino)imidazole ribonucleotide synthase [Polymorphum gilvum]|uniref:N5-carboxyaminoimidazole ribonucleotide synthase n=1 Tax=Polymorphum gilvum (strain LMG 25793 / CGMCC 1.9160 / SL003B-26A1) TaxID=991905 RepID=F2IX21_POLGS|nr:5-(carboxyamino)imidazole ribonucleotide synthase [Polymorphum gilvum]ADZ69313.1 Phosphoribosylaminoimidazole carboxylase, ATPase subunit [Polymorphum gilvum SL003B-26A1]
MADTVRLRPGDTIGILGGGQLGRMLALAAASLGLKTHIFCPEPDSPAFDVTADFTIAAYDDIGALNAFAAAVSVVTYEFENVPGPTAAHLAARVPVRPGPTALEVSQDRLSEKDFLSGAGIELATYARIDSDDDLKAALERFGGRGVLKTRRFGYDGKGQVMLRQASDQRGARRAIGDAPAVLEQLITFEKEVSVIVARGVSGQTEVYDVTENRHEHHILKTSTVPASVSASTAATAKTIAGKIAESLDYVGVMGVEMFVVADGDGERLLVNEIAPRVHNSGHWTEDACLTSQFEQHMRAVAGWPLGSAERHSDVIMENLIGNEAESWEEILREPGARLHLYGKRASRPGRKMGHVNRIRPKSA